MIHQGKTQRATNTYLWSSIIHVHVYTYTRNSDSTQQRGLISWELTIKRSLPSSSIGTWRYWYSLKSLRELWQGIHCQNLYLLSTSAYKSLCLHYSFIHHHHQCINYDKEKMTLRPDTTTSPFSFVPTTKGIRIHCLLLVLPRIIMLRL